MAIRVTHAPSAQVLGEAAFAGGKEERDRYLEQFALKKHEAEARELAQFQANQRANRAMNLQAMQFAQRREDAQMAAAMQARRQDLQMAFGLRKAELDRQSKADSVAGITERSAARDAADMARFQAGIKEREGVREEAAIQQRKTDLLNGSTEGLKGFAPYLNNLDNQTNQEAAGKVRAAQGKIRELRRLFMGDEIDADDFSSKSRGYFDEIQGFIDEGAITQQQSVKESYDATVLERDEEGNPLWRLGPDGKEVKSAFLESQEEAAKQKYTHDAAMAKVEADIEKARLDNRTKSIAAIEEMAKKAGETELKRLQEKAQADEKFSDAPTELSATDQARILKEATQAYLDIGAQFDAAMAGSDEVHPATRIYNNMSPEQQAQADEAIDKTIRDLMRPAPRGPGMSRTAAVAEARNQFVEQFGGQE